MTTTEITITIEPDITIESDLVAPSQMFRNGLDGVVDRVMRYYPEVEVDISMSRVESVTTEYVGPVSCVEIAVANAGIELGPAQIGALAQELVDMGANFDA